MIRGLFVFAFVVMSLMTFAQDRPVCQTNAYIQQLEMEDPGYVQRLKEIDEQVDAIIRNKESARTSADTTVYYIPVVFHVVYNIPVENVSDEQLFSQLDVLNEDFRRLNADAEDTPEEFADVAGDAYIQFVLAGVDPDGNPTDGITRTETSITQWNLFASPGDDNYAENIKFTDKGGHDVWDRNCYLNIWVGDLGSSILGYAQPPGGSSAKDGVVIGYKWIGRGGSSVFPYNKGRTATHEIGHWMSLKHIWGDDGGSCAGSDLVADTPNQAEETYGCPAFPKTDACSPTAPGIMFMNYMDYTNDACMNLFTQGQVNKMRGVMENTREEILECASTVNIPGPDSPHPFGISVYPNPASDVMVLRLNGLYNGNLLIETYNVMGQKMSSQNITGNLTTHLMQIDTFPAGTYLLRVTDGNKMESIQFIVHN